MAARADMAVDLDYADKLAIFEGCCDGCKVADFGFDYFLDMGCRWDCEKW
jgi:hypothetical protein